MLALKIIVFLAAFAAVCSLALHQSITWMKEYAFYKNNDWDFSVDSGLDRIDERIAAYPLGLTNWQRLYLFRPFYIAILILVLVVMAVSLFK